MENEGESRRSRRRANAERNWQVILRAGFIGAYCLVLLVAGIYLGMKGREVQPAQAPGLNGPATTVPDEGDAEPDSAVMNEAPAAPADPATSSDTTTATGEPTSPDARPSLPTVSGTEPAGSTQTQTTAQTDTPADTQASTQITLVQPTISEEVVEEVLEWPVQGEVVGEPGWVFSDYADEWRYLPGVDIAADPGESVKAAMTGTVTSVHSDPILGTVVTIEHEDGRATEYGRLSGCMLGVGDRVKQGEAIARADGATIYFGTSVDGEAVSVVECMTR